MVASTLRKLADPHLSSGEIARLLRKHVGANPSLARCEEALAEVGRVKALEVRVPAQVYARLVGEEPCSTIEGIINLLLSMEEKESR